MAKTRTRITIDTEDAYKRAFNAAASLSGLTIQELFERWVAEHAPEELSRARKAIEDEEKPEKKGKRP